VEVADLAARSRADRRADRRFATRTARSELPSGRDAYRRLADVELEVKELALRHPTLARALTLPHPTLEGRAVVGLEIGEDPGARDGRPVLVSLGAHHAREWPSVEHVMELAHDLLAGYGADERITRLLGRTRAILVPVVNPDGFNVSREADPAGAPDFALLDYEMKRKNCRPAPSPAYAGPCAASPAGRLGGVDPNRNYGGLWGGPGAGVFWGSDTFRGAGPFSEPETQNVRELLSTRQVTTLVSNHTYANLVLRPPGVAATRPPLEEPLYAALGERLAARNGYASVPGHRLYDTTGTTEDWSFWTTGGLGFTFEIGGEGFHPPFERAVVDEYLGRGSAAGAGRGGNRAAYLELLEATADASLHGVLAGEAPAGATLRLERRSLTPTWPVWGDDAGGSVGEPLRFEDVLADELVAPGGRFTWHVNPSTRPLVAGRLGRDPVAPPQAPAPLANPPGYPAPDPGQRSFEDVAFEVQGPPAADNGRLAVAISWASPRDDWDLVVLDGRGRVVAESLAPQGTSEAAAVVDPPPGRYVARVLNYAAAQGTDWSGEVRFEAPPPTTRGERERWSLTCTSPGGEVHPTREVAVDRGERVELGEPCAAPADG
ncbi:MAG: peptidase M14, partial [Actinomycetota bacterium]|nr:peptidase M14 [Actinomycetota bacterium]